MLGAERSEVASGGLDAPLEKGVFWGGVFGSSRNHHGAADQPVMYLLLGDGVFIVSAMPFGLMVCDQGSLLFVELLSYSLSVCT